MQYHRETKCPYYIDNDNYVVIFASFNIYFTRYYNMWRILDAVVLKVFATLEIKNGYVWQYDIVLYLGTVIFVLQVYILNNYNYL